ncbi:MAG: Rieske (2Fe-2S) protein [Candidatus Bathyarchaeota archaeon]|nr:Rieske (2Fe-2S) protein [Candidatus Bathyarchaeota archaeon]
MSSDFVSVIKADELEEGKIKQATLVGRNILLMKVNGKVYGTASRCPHMGCLLAGGQLKEYILTCPCHGWSFDIRNGQYQNNKAIILATYECKEENGQVYVKMFDDF